MSYQNHHVSARMLLLAGLLLSQASAADELWQAFADGDVYANLRLRYEHVDTEGAASTADATTLRTVLGYESGRFHGFSTLLELENVFRLGGDFSEYPGQPGRPFPLIADPNGTELNQGYLRYEAPGNNDIRLGRQIITYRDAPFHRFIGTVLWRQNWQTFDAVRAENTALPDTTINYAYVWQVNRIFGHDAPSPLDEFDSDSHLVNIQYDALDAARMQGYAYLLDFDNAPAASSQTYGFRLAGTYDHGGRMTPGYALEYAHQSDYGSNASSYNANYQLAEVSLSIKPEMLLDKVVLKAGFERLSGDGQPNGAFQTVLGTNHAFQGTADQFLSTPADGIRDYNLTGIIQAHGFKLIAAYHVLESDHLGYRYGEEVDLQLTRGLGKHFSLGVKYANYMADSNALNMARGVNADVEKFWLFATASFR